MNMGKHQTKVGRRERRGVSKNKTPTPVEAISVAAKTIGKDGKGCGKQQGYFEALAVSQPKRFAALLGRLLAGDDDQSEITPGYWLARYASVVEFEGNL
jgi:hypothetical protein